LLCLLNEETFLRGSLDYKAPDMCAESIFNLEAGTEYEAHLQLRDPDGCGGNR